MIYLFHSLIIWKIFNVFWENRIPQLSFYDEFISILLLVYIVIKLIFQKHIHIFMSYYCIYIFKIADPYYTSILWTDIKRWEKINEHQTIHDIEKYYFNIYYLLTDIFRFILLNNILHSDLMIFFKNINENFKEDDIYGLVDLSIKYNLDDILNKLNSYTNLSSYIQNKYPKKLK